MMFGLNPITLYFIAFLIFTNLVSAFGWQWNKNAVKAEREKTAVCQTKFDSFKQQVEILGKQQERKTADVIAASNLAVSETRKSYETSLARLRADYQRVRNQYAKPGASTSPVPSTDISTRGINAAPADAVPDPARFEADCAKTTLDLIWLQEHERQQREANK